jgi:hypothetical protein
MSEKVKFILSRGVLAWGIPMFLVMTGWDVFRDRASLLQTPSKAIFAVLLGMVFWLTGGACFGWFMWVSNEKQKGKNQITRLF